MFWGFSEWPRASCSSSHVGGMSTLQTLLLRLFLPVGGCRSSGWALVLLAFVLLFSWRWCSSLVWGLRVLFFRACGPPGRLSQRQLLGVDRNGVFTEAARCTYHLSLVWANGVLDLGDGFRVLNPIGNSTRIFKSTPTPIFTSGATPERARHQERFLKACGSDSLPNNGPYPGSDSRAGLLCAMGVIPFTRAPSPRPRTTTALLLVCWSVSLLFCRVSFLVELLASRSSFVLGFP